MTFDPIFVKMHHSEKQHNENDLIEHVFLYKNPLKNNCSLQILQFCYDYFVQLVGYIIVIYRLYIRNTTY